ncbi:MAG: M20/M25/M40 family metallo-hydrolase [Deltaproteobacteria bacterium]|nr:M20/M25/M40 family metallo-hydrolase [Deltaproteobacteria bacterium]
MSVDECAARLRCHVQALAGDIGERNVWRPAALAAAAGYIRGELEALGYAVRPQTYRVNDVDCDNLEVVIPGAARPQEIVLAGAHYNTVEGSPGANDNASGVAGVLELARQLRGARLARTVKLVAFVNEEPPFFFSGEMGSKLYAQAARRRGDDIRVMLSLEMLGCYSDTPRSQAYPLFLRWFYPDRGNFIAFVSNLRSRLRLREVVAAFRANSDFPSEHLASPAFVPGVAWSDQLSFWRQGYAAVMVTDTAFYRYRHYHGPLDTPEKLSYPEMAQVITGLAKTIAALAGEPIGPVGFSVHPN